MSAIIPSPVTALLQRIAQNDHTASEAARLFPVPSTLPGASDAFSQAYAIIARRAAGDTSASEAARLFLQGGVF